MIEVVLTRRRNIVEQASESSHRDIDMLQSGRSAYVVAKK